MPESNVKTLKFTDTYKYHKARRDVSDIGIWSKIAEIHRSSYMQMLIEYYGSLSFENKLLMSQINELNVELQNAKRVIALNKLDTISKLEDDWNDNGAQRFSKALVDKCYEILSRLDHVPEVFPVADGSIQFEYKESDGSYLEFDIFEDKICEYRLYPDGSDEEKIIAENRISSISKEVEDFYERRGK